MHVKLFIVGGGGGSLFVVLYGTCTCTRIQYAVPQNPYQIKSHTTDIFTSALQKRLCMC